MSNGNPFANWVINNQYPTLDQPQPTAPEFGATLPTQPPDGGGGEPVTKKYEWKATIHTSRPLPAGATHVRLSQYGADGTHLVSTRVPVNPAAKEFRVVGEEEIADETENPNPPDVIVLPKGAKGVDVSAYQPDFFAVVDVNDLDFAWVRCSDGMYTGGNFDSNGIDKELFKNAAALHESGKPWWVFHFLRQSNVSGQIQKVKGILDQLQARGTYPRQAKLDDGTLTPVLVIDVELISGNTDLTLNTVKTFYDAFAVPTGIYTSKYYWGLIAAFPVWWSDVFCIFADYGTNNGQVPNRAPLLPVDFKAGHIWQYSSLVGNEYRWIKPNLDGDIVGPYTAVVKPPDPPTGATVDLLPYFKPSGKHGRYVVFHFSDGRTQAQQMELLADGRTILWKGEGQQIDGKTVYDYEEIKADDGGIRKFKDTSSGGRTAYDLAGAVWLPRFVQVGKVYESKPTVRNFDRVNCQTTATAVTTDYIYVKELLPVWISPINPAIKFYNVLVCEWRKTPDIKTPPIEVYKLAVDVLYCEWNNGAVGELPEGRAPLSFQLTNC